MSNDYGRRVRGPGITPRQVKAARALIGADQAQFAEAMGIARPSFAQYELGNTRLAGDAAQAFMAACAKAGVGLIGPNIPAAHVPDLSQAAEGVVALTLREKDAWVVNGVITDTPPAARPVLNQINPFNVSFDGASVTGSIAASNKSDIDRLIALLQAYKSLMPA